MKRSKRREKRRSTILKVASSVFSREGYHKAKMDDIAITAGIGKGTIYQYFSSKQELFQDVIKEGVDLYLDMLEKELAETDDCYEAFKKIVIFSFKFMEKNIDISRVVVSHLTTVDDNMVKWIDEKKTEMIKALAKVVDKHISEGKFRKVNPDIAAHCFFGMILSPVAESIFHNRKLDETEIPAQIVDIFLNGLLNDVANTA